MYSCDDTPKGGLPHSDIHGSKPARGSPWLFAACHVLHRLLVPRHPPNALILLRSTASSPEGTAPPCTETIVRSAFWTKGPKSRRCFGREADKITQRFEHDVQNRPRSGVSPSRPSYVSSGSQSYQTQGPSSHHPLREMILDEPIHTTPLNPRRLN